MKCLLRKFFGTFLFHQSTGSLGDGHNCHSWLALTADKWKCSYFSHLRDSSCTKKQHKIKKSFNKNQEGKFQAKDFCVRLIWEPSFVSAAGAQCSPLSLRTIQSPSSSSLLFLRATSSAGPLTQLLCRRRPRSIKPDWFVFYLPSSHANSRDCTARRVGESRKCHIFLLCNVTTGVGQADKENSLSTDTTTEAPPRPSRWLLLRFAPMRHKATRRAT